MKKGFTLIELMIVIAIIAIIAAIAIPSLIKSKISANEGAAAAGLKTFNGMMGTFKKKGYNNAGRVYPQGTGGTANTGKYCGLYYEVNNNRERVTLIGVADANADCRADGDTDSTAGDIGIYVPSIRTTAATQFQIPSTWGSAAKQGYWYALCGSCLSIGGGVAYTYGPQAAVNHYGLMAFPDSYGSSGESTFAISEEGTVYTVDFGDALYRDYPGRNPIDAGWSIAE